MRRCANCKYYTIVPADVEPCKSCFNTYNKPNYIDAENNKKVPVGSVTVDMVNEPPHYKQGGMETIDEMILVFGKEAVANFCICNAWKYRARALYKNKQEDMDKSHWYLKKYKELMEDCNARY